MEIKNNQYTDYESEFKSGRDVLLTSHEQLLRSGKRVLGNIKPGVEPLTEKAEAEVTREKPRPSRLKALEYSRPVRNYTVEEKTITHMRRAMECAHGMIREMKMAARNIDNKILKESIMYMVDRLRTDSTGPVEKIERYIRELTEEKK